MTTTRTEADWRELLRSRTAWDEATQTVEAAEEARDWLSETMVAIDQQFATFRTVGRLPDDEWSDHLDWRAAATGFKRVCVARKRELDRRIKAMHKAESEAGRDAYLQARARADYAALADAWDEGNRASLNATNPYRSVR